MPVHGRRDGGDRDGGAHVHGRGARAAHLAAAADGVRVEGVAGGWVREARVGSTRRGGALHAVAETVLVRRLRHPPDSAG